MATIRKRGDYQWQALIRRKGFPELSKTFELKVDAEDWARDVERDMRRGIFIDRREGESTTFFETINRYSIEVSPLKKSHRRELVRLKMLKSLEIAPLFLSSIKPKHIATYRDARRKLGLAENTIRLDIALISAIFETCRKDWGIEVENPCRKIKLPAGSGRRERRLSKEEELALLTAAPIAMPRSMHVRELLELLIETGMRESEMLGVEWRDIDIKKRSIRLDETKSGDPRDVPLSSRAINIIQSLPHEIKGGRVFKIRQDGFIRGFKKACKLAISRLEQPIDGFCEDLKPHDLRHEAASRWANVLEAHELCKMFGWKTMQMALRYYHPRVEDLAMKLG